MPKFMICYGALYGLAFIVMAGYFWPHAINLVMNAMVGGWLAGLGAGQLIEKRRKFVAPPSQKEKP